MDASSASCSSRAVLPSQTEEVQQWPSHFCNTHLPTMRIWNYTHPLKGELHSQAGFLPGWKRLRMVFAAESIQLHLKILGRASHRPAACTGHEGEGE